MFSRHDAQPGDEEQRFVEGFKLAALQAGSVAHRLQGEIPTLKKQGASTPESAALTMADLATQDVILHLMHAMFPEAVMDAEEDTQTTRLFAGIDESGRAPEAGDADRPIIVVDPIDGTYNYARGSDDYAVMGGWLREGAYQAAVVRFPVWGKTYWADRRHGCWLQQDGQPARQVHCMSSGQRILVTPRLPQAWIDALRGAGFEIDVSRCSAVDATAPINGRASASVSVGPTSRRRPTGLFLSLMAGGSVLFAGRAWSGEDPVHLVQDGEPVIAAASAELAGQIRQIIDRCP